MGGSAVRSAIERNTRAKLDNIQLNGTVLGAIVGAGVGALALLLSHILG